MSMNIDRGLFLLDFSDYHAMLGVPIDADTQTIRKRYLKIARRLHPDSCASESEDDRRRASEFLSKLVNPAWEKLSQEKEKEEYDLLLKLKGQQAARQGNLDLGALGKELSTASNPDHFYRSSIKNLAEKQFDHLDQTLDVIGQISELNIAYLMRKEGAGGAKANSTTAKPIYTGSNLPDSSQSGTPPTPMPTAPPRRETVSDQYYRRAEGYMAKNNLAQAVLELRDALRLEPHNSRCHALLGEVYRRQNQQTMAKIHFNKALEFDPNNELALQGRQRLETQSNAGKATGAAAKAGTQKQNPKPGKASNTGKSNGNSGGGLFGLFGGKKK